MKAAGRAIRAAGSGMKGAAAVLRQEMVTLQATLRSADLSPTGWLTPGDLAIILRTQPLKERDKLVTFLTEKHGKLTGVAKGAIHSKRFGGTLDLFACSSLRYKEGAGELVFVEEANLRRDFLRLREKLENISAAGYFADLILRLTEDRHPVREVFLLLAHYLYLLEEHTATFEIVLMEGRLACRESICKCICKSIHGMAIAVKPFILAEKRVVLERPYRDRIGA